MAQERETRVVMITSESEARELRIAAAELGISVSKFCRTTSLAMARGQLRADSRLPGIDGAQSLPDWLTKAG